ncbi:glutathione S-transferase family protein [Noviherbaspirillum sp. CPCC 100848]|uniref:Glutathione S-transferase family protein n=2 Tax=Noviherbaspirillum album TaxID=3080276 RepID=A0ABU6JJ40_9BURK|nr:glutathione S-transferase family protein [Noviherbaspirillum sp. CPCC 100848]
MQSVRIVGMRPVWGLRSPSPFCLKLETWLRMAEIPYETIALNKPPQSKTGKVPYMLLENGAALADSNIIIRTLARERGVDLDLERTPEEQARGHAILRMVEESLYFVAVWERWMLPEFWPVTRDGYFGTMPGPLRTLFAGLVRRKLKAALHGQGILRYEPDEIVARGVDDIRSLSALLGQQPFFLGERAGVVDATVYGALANLLGFPGHTPLKSAVEGCPNLIAFCRRIEDAWC